MVAPGLRFGRYEVGDRIGKGGFGVVHFARDVELDRELAIKFLRPEYQVRPNVVQRFLQEARAAARIGHPGIVTVFECGQIAGTGLRADGTAFIAMELLKGKSLAETLELSGRMSLELALSIGRQLAAALASAHASGIIHRDLKPDNVYLVPDPAVRGGVRVKILDFGVAKLAEAAEGGVHTHSQVMLGTPRYMAPEQARSAARVDHRSDIYSLGCILYELLSGRPPYGGDAGDVITKHQSAPIPPLRPAAEATPPALDRLISTMLAKTPDERPPSMTDVDATLGACETLAASPRAGTRGGPSDPAAIAEAATMPMPRREESTLIQAPDAAHSTLSEATAVRLPRQPAAPARRTRLGLMVAGGVALGGLVLGALVTVIVLRSEGDPPPSGGGSSITGAEEAPADAPADALSVVQEDPPAPPGPSEIVAPPVVVGNSELEIECLRYQRDQRWADLDACADRLAAASVASWKDFKERATLEVRAQARIAAFEDAMTKGNLKDARAELDRIPTAATDYARLRQRYDAVEAKAIADVAARLKRALAGADCKEYDLIVAQERASKPPRVAQEATRQVKCAAAPPAVCDDKALADRGREHFAAGQFAAAMDLFEKAWSCKPDPSHLLKAFAAACNLPLLPKAKLFWKRMSPSSRQTVIGVCVRNGISAEMLDSP